MAIKLTQGADASIVTGATRSGLAMAPGDYSKTFQAVANNYRQTIASSAAMWSQIGNVVGQIAGEIGKNAAIEQGFDENVQGLLDIEGNEFVYDIIKENKDKMKNSFKGIIIDQNGKEIKVDPNGEEAKRYRRKLGIEKESLYKQTDDHMAVREIARENILANNIDYTALEPGQGEILNAIVAYGTPSGKTEKGNYVRLSMNENNELVYTLYNDKQQVVGKQDVDDTDKVFTQKDPTIGPKRAGEGKEFKIGGKSISVTASQLNSLVSVAPNKNLKNDYAKIGSTLVGTGKTIGGEYSEYTKNEVKSQVELLAGDSPATLRQSMNTRINGVSFIEDMNREGSEISQNLFMALGNVVGVDPKTQTLQKQGLLRGVDEMTDGKKGISSQDLQNSGNMKILQYSLVYDENNYNLSKEVFSNWAVNNFGGSYKHGSNQIKPNINTPKLTQKQQEVQSQLNTLNNILDGNTSRSFSLQGGNLMITIDPISKTITQKSEGQEDTINPQSFLDILTKTPGLLDAREIFGSDYFPTTASLPVKKKGKPGTMLGRFFNSFASDNIEQ